MRLVFDNIFLMFLKFILIYLPSRIFSVVNFCFSGIEMDSVVRYLTLSASAICTEIYILDAVQPSELFPTAIRNIGIGFIQTFNRIGNTLAPQIFVTVSILGCSSIRKFKL